MCWPHWSSWSWTASQVSAPSGGLIGPEEARLRTGLMLPRDPLMIPRSDCRGSIMAGTSAMCLGHSFAAKSVDARAVVRVTSSSIQSTSRTGGVAPVDSGLLTLAISDRAARRKARVRPRSVSKGYENLTTVAAPGRLDEPVAEIVQCGEPAQ